MMTALAFIVRHMEYEKCMLIYFIAMVSFSSAIANQYLAIPMAALCILSTRPFDIIYMVFSGGFLTLHVDCLDIISRIHGSGMLKCFAERYVRHGYRVAVIILLCAIIKVIYTERDSVMLFQMRKNAQ